MPVKADGTHQRRQQMTDPAGNSPFHQFSFPGIFQISDLFIPFFTFLHKRFLCRCQLGDVDGLKKISRKHFVLSDLFTLRFRQRRKLFRHSDLSRCQLQLFFDFCNGGSIILFELRGIFFRISVADVKNDTGTQNKRSCFVKIHLASVPHVKSETFQCGHPVGGQFHQIDFAVPFEKR